MIRLLLTDLDGTLTDGSYYVFSDHDGIVKKFNTRDFHGMMLLQQKNKVQIMVVTMARGSVIRKQIERMKSIMDVDLMTKVQDKKAMISNYVESGRYSWDEIAFIGDDVNDIELLKVVGFAGCPADAEPEVIETVRNHEDGYLCERRGGKGCVREFCDLIRSFDV